MKKHILFFSLVISTSLYSQSWNTTGNSGTNPSTNFIGTTDNQSLVFKTNNVEQMRLSPNGRLIFFNINSQTYDKNLYIGGGNDAPYGNGGTTNWANTAVGLGSMVSNTTGATNTALGYNSLANNTVGSGNTAIGINSIIKSASGNYNVALGLNALNGFNIGEWNVALGTSAIASGNLNGNRNIAIGGSSLRYINSGNSNIIIGTEAFRAITSGSNNISIGDSNARYITSGSNNIYIGNSISPINSQPNNELNIGNWIYGMDGKISIGGKSTFTCSDCTDYSLFVKNGIKAEKVKVDIASANGWADYVFKKDYQLQTLEEVEKHITNKGHLPNVPSAEEVAKNGINVAEMDAKLLEKIEELTLYSIEQNKQIKKLQEENSEFKKQAEKIEKLEKLLLELTSKK